MNAWAIALAVLLSAWLALSAVAQLSARWPRFTTLRRFDPLGLLPHYHFFCPTPVRHDYHLLARTIADDGTPARWREVMGPPHRLWWSFAWNPDRRAYKSLCDLMQVVDSGDDDPRAVQVSIAYLAILAHTTAVAESWHEPGAARVQFLLAVSHGLHASTPPQAVFMSTPHRLAEADDSHPGHRVAADGDPRLRGRARLVG